MKDTPADRIATIDVGTNTALLLIAEHSPGGMHVCLTDDRFVRLGAGVDRNRVIQREAMERLRQALLAFKELAHAYDAYPVIIGATSASRDARNAGELVDYVYEHTGLTYGLLSGQEEALWSFNGALSDATTAIGDVATVDIGGGSTEVVIGNREDAFRPWDIRDKQSIDMGSVRLTERFFESQPPGMEAVERARAWVMAQLAASRLSFPSGALMIGASGTTTSLALLEGGTSKWENLSESHPEVSLERIKQWERRLLGLTYDEVLALDPAVLAGRADVFPAGVLILACACAHFGVRTCRLTNRGLRHGLAMRYWSRLDAP